MPVELNAYKCNYCGAILGNEKECCQHESVCSKNPQIKKCQYREHHNDYDHPYWENCGRLTSQVQYGLYLCEHHKLYGNGNSKEEIESERFILDLLTKNYVRSIEHSQNPVALEYLKKARIYYNSKPQIYEFKHNRFNAKFLPEEDEFEIENEEGKIWRMKRKDFYEKFSKKINFNY